MQVIPAMMLEKMQKAFNTIDADHDGKISKAEIQAICIKRKLEWKEADYTAAFKDLDPASQTLTLAQLNQIKSPQLGLLFLLMMIDTNEDGYLSFAEVKDAVTSIPSLGTPGEEELRMFFDMADANKDGMLSFQEVFQFAKQFVPEL